MRLCFSSGGKFSRLRSKGKQKLSLIYAAISEYLCKAWSSGKKTFRAEVLKSLKSIDRTRRCFFIFRSRVSNQNTYFQRAAASLLRAEIIATKTA
jgi:hypothetical protein